MSFPGYKERFDQALQNCLSSYAFGTEADHWEIVIQEDEHQSVFSLKEDEVDHICRMLVANDICPQRATFDDLFGFEDDLFSALIHFYLRGLPEPAEDRGN